MGSSYVITVILVFLVLVNFIKSDDSGKNSCSKSKRAIKKNMIKSYKYYGEELNWLYASISCLSKCGELAVIESEKEHKAAFKRLDDKPVKDGTWIGLVYENKMFWQNGRPGVSKASLPFSNFFDSNPIPNEIGCYSLKNTGYGFQGKQWVVGRCFLKKPYLCQFLKDKKEKPSPAGATETVSENPKLRTIKQLNSTRSIDFEGQSQINFWSPMFFFPAVKPQELTGVVRDLKSLPVSVSANRYP